MFYSTRMVSVLCIALTAMIVSLPSPERIAPAQAPQSAPAATAFLDANENLLALPKVGDHTLRILSPNVLELSLVTTKSPDAHGETWDFVTEEGALRLPPTSHFRVLIDGKEGKVEAVGFRRRVLYAPLKPRDLRIGNFLVLRLASPIPESAVVEVKSADETLLLPNARFVARADRLRLSPVLHVNQVGYMPEYEKKAMIGSYLGSLGELDLGSLSEFQLLDSRTGKTVYTGRLKPRLDRGWELPTLPYQHVLEADFTAYRVPGEYRLWAAGLGVSLPFRIDAGVTAAFARTYALGLYHQRCGAANALPFTRFVHAPCHIAPADVPTMENKSVQRQLSGESGNYKSNPRHTAPQLKDVNSSLYPFVRQGKTDVAGGHHDAGDYSKYTLNSAQLIHTLLFSADVFPGAAALDNLGLPESGDGKSDLLQLAKWEADFLAKMQDDDGGFYFLVYPRDRAYENDVLPDPGDPQVVFPKTTSATSAAVAALAQAASSPGFKKTFPEAAALYLQKARKGWAFLERAWAKYGRDGAYQKITHYGDFAMQDDETAWAATELYLATGEAKYHDTLRKLFDPSDKETRHWTWERLFESYGSAVRSYAFAVQSGRVPSAKLDPIYLAKCRAEILACAQDHADWAASNAYGTSFPTESKRFRTAGWYFSTAQAFDIAAAEQLAPQPRRLDAILGNLNFEAGCNPNNVVFVTGLGWKRQREIVHQYAMNDRRILPPSGIPLGSLQEGFMYLENYKKELGALTFPPDGAQASPYPIYDRWGDSFNVSTEFTIPIQGRCLGTLAWLMGLSAKKDQKWRAANAHIVGIPAATRTGVRYPLTLKVEGLNPEEAQIVWEATGQEPQFGTHDDFTPTKAGPQWIEAEALWPDGRRAFAVFECNADAAPPAPQKATALVKPALNLLEQGANPNAQTPSEARYAFEATALAEARKCKDGQREEFIRLLRQFGAKK